MLSSREILWAHLFFLMLPLKTKIAVILVRATTHMHSKVAAFV